MSVYKEQIEMPSLPVKIIYRRTNGNHIISAAPHWHKEVEILLFHEGRACQQLDHHSFMTNKRDIVICGSGQVHSTQTFPKESCEIVVIQFCFESFVRGGALLPPDLQQMNFFGSISATDPAYQEIYETIIGLCKELTEEKPAYKVCTQALICRLYALLIRGKGVLPLTTAKIEDEKYKEPIAQSLDYIYRHYQEKISLCDAAKSARLSMNHFLRLFGRVTGMTFLQYLNLYRVNKAEELLLSGSSVTFAAMESGFDNVNSFIRNFKKYKHCTPSQYTAQKYR